VATFVFQAAAAELDRSILRIAASGVGLPPADYDFTQLAAGQEFIPNHLLVRFAFKVETAQREQILSALGGGQIEREYEMVPGLCLVALPEGQTVQQALLTYNGTAGILYAEPDYLVYADVVPNDARFSELWGMHNTGQTGGTPGADIHATDAWDSATGSRQIVVAVIDTGVDYTHPDLTNNIWTNPGEIPGNGVDDDGNGYVDDVYGYDFVNDDPDPMDDNNHGTHCSGTVGGEGNNSIGVAGVCWQVRIMALKAFSAAGSGGTADEISSIQYATLMGAQVMSASWGGYGYSQALKDAIDAAGAAGIIFVAAAGNSATDNDIIPHYPSSYTSENIVAVMATDHNDIRSSFSSYGLTSVDLAAPGTDILSCVIGGGYEFFNGTSMATPHVAGACALLLSAHPTLTVAEIKRALLSTVDVVVPGLCVSGGRLNLEGALLSLGPRSPLMVYTNYLTGGNGNGMIDFNECNNLSLVLTNVGTTNITGIRATLSTTTPDVVIAQSTVTYPNILPGGFAVNPLPFKVSSLPSFVCGIPVDFTLVIKSDQFTGTNRFRLATGSPGIPVRFDNSTPAAIPDLGETDSVIVVSNVTSALNKVTVSLHITHTYDLDLVIELISPDGTTNLLSASNGSFGDNYGIGCGSDSQRTTFDDEAALPISAGFPPFLGSFQPQRPLSVFIGKAGTNINGSWRLRVQDQFASDTGTLQCWSLFLTPADCKDGGGECPGSDLALGMVGKPEPTVVGNTLTYLIGVTNHGPSSAGNVVVTHLLPNGVIFVSAVSSQGTCSQAGGLVTCNLGTLTYGGQATITVVTTPVITGALSSTASATSNQLDPDPSNNSATFVSHVNPVAADLVVGLAAAPSPLVLGNPLTYTISVTNNGPSAATGVNVTNILPAGAAVVSATVSQGSITAGGGLWTIGALASGARVTATIVVMPAAEGTITATATVAGNQLDPLVANNVAAVSTVVGPAADLAITIGDSPDPAVVLSNVTYLVSVTNRGPSAATGVQMSGTLPVGVNLISRTPSQGAVSIAGNALTWLLGTLNSGTKATLTIVVQTTTNLPLSTSATVAGSEPDPNPANNSAAATTQVALPGVAITKAGATLTAESFSPPNGAIDVGETVTVILRLRNSSNVNTLNLVGTLMTNDSVVPVPPNNPQTYGVLAPSGFPVGRSFSFTANGTNEQTINPTLLLRDGTNNYPPVSFEFTLPSAHSFANTNVILIPDPAAPNPPYPLQSGPGMPYPSVIPVSNLNGTLGKVTVTLSNLNHTYPGDVNVLLVAPSGAKTLLMSHAGDQPTTSVTLTFDDNATDALPIAGPLSTGVWQPTAYGLAPTFPPSAPAGPYSGAMSAFNGTSPNGTWSLYVFDDAGGDQGTLLGGWSMTLSLIVPVNQLADLAVSVADTPDPVVAGSALTYTFTVANGGPSTATSVAFTNVLPAGVTLVSAASSQGLVLTNANTVLANLGTLNTNAAATVTIVVIPSLSLIPPGGDSVALNCTAMVGSGETDPNPGNSTVTAVTTITRPVADVGIVSLTAAPEPAVDGFSLTNTVVITNFGPSTALAVIVSNPLPAGVTFVPGDSTVGCTNIGGTVTCPVGDLAPNAGTTVDIVVIPPGLGLLTNTVMVTASSQDPNLANNSASSTSNVTTPTTKITDAGAELIYESGPANGMIDPGETVSLNFRMANVGTLDTVNLKATLLVTNGVTTPSSPQYYGLLIQNGPSVSRNYTFTAAAGYSNAVVATFQVQDERVGVTNTSLAPVAFAFNRPLASVWSNSTAIIIPDHGVATPYPSTVTVSDLEGVVTKATVTFKGLTHSFPHDVSALLVSPDGGNVLLMSHAGGGLSVSNLTLTFDDAATNALPNNGLLTSTAYRPGSYPGTVVFPGPAPGGVHGDMLQAFVGRDPNGTWSLYVLDDTTGDSGFIMNSWSLNLETAVTLRPMADLAISLSTAPASLFVGGILTSTIWVTNLGPAEATAVLVTNALSSGQQVVTNLGNLDAGAVASASVVLSPSAGGNIKSTASVGSNEADPYSQNNSAQTTTTVFTPVPSVVSGSVVNGEFELVVIAQPTFTYAIEASTNLQSWTVLNTYTAVPGPYRFTDTNAPSFGQRFYRTRQVSP